MAQSNRAKLELIRELFNSNEIDQASRRLMRMKPDRLADFDRGFYYFLRGRLDMLDGPYTVENCNRALRLLKKYTDTSDLFFWALLVKGIIFHKVHQWKRGVEIFRSIVRDAAAAGYHHVEASAVGQLAWHYAVTGDFQQADLLFSEAIDRYHFEEVKHHRREMIHNRAYWLARYGRFSESDSTYLADPISVDEIGTKLGPSFTINQAFILSLRIHLKEARYMLRTFKRLRASASQNHSYWVNLGVLHLIAGKHKSAGKHLENALRLAMKIRQGTLATIYKWIAVNYLQGGYFEEARRYAQLALKRGRRNGEAFEVGGAYFVLGVLDAVGYPGNPRSARRNIVRSLQTYARIDARWDLAMVQHVVSQLHIFEGSQQEQLAGLSTRYFASEGIIPPSEFTPQYRQVAARIQGLSPEALRRLKELLDIK